MSIALLVLLLCQTASSGGPVIESSTVAAAALPTIAERAMERWNGDIVALETKAEAEPNDDQAVLVIGSSSIRLWGDEGMAAALSPFQTIRRGYGGAAYVDLAVFAERLIHPEDYRALVLFAGNDVRGQADDQSLEDVEASVHHIIDVSKRHQPSAPILIIEVTPTPSRYHARDRLIELNALLRKIALVTPGVSFLPTWEHYLDGDAKPRPELFRDDDLHQNDRGYQLWSKLIRDALKNLIPVGDDNL